MTCFCFEDYCAEKRKLILDCAAGRNPGLSRVFQLRKLGGKPAENDYDLDVLTVDIKTRHLEKKVSEKKTAALLLELQRNEPEQKSAYAVSFLRAFADYYSKSELRAKRRKKALFTGAVLLLVLIICGAVGLFYADRTGAIYGTGDVSFTADGQTYTQNAVRYNEYVTLKLPEKAGYDIVGVNDRYTGERLFNGEGIAVEKIKERDLSDYSECDLTVVYVPHLYSASVQSATGTVSGSFGYTVEDDPADLLDEPQHLMGYIFDGWYTDPEFKKPFTGRFADYTDEPLVLYPHYSLDGWLIVWDTQGGEMLAGALDRYTIMTDVPLPKGDVVKKKGYRLIGWTVNGIVADHFPATSMQDVLIVALWEPEVYSLSYQLNGGELFDPVSEYTIEDDLLLPIPVRPAYHFDGWYDSASFRTPIEGIERGSLGDRTVYAKWTPITYRIEYDLSGGMNNPLNPVTYQADRDIFLAEPRRAGYCFDGWYDHLTGECKTELSAVEDGSVTLIAAWTPKQHTITVYTDIGGNAISQTVTYDGYYCLQSPLYKGYTLAGYEMGGQAFDSVGVYGYDSDVSVIAHYKANEYQIVYVSDGTTVCTQPVVYGQPYCLFSPEERENYEFVGWTDRAVGGDPVNDGIYDRDGNSVLYAVWTKTLKIELESGHDYTVDNTIEKVYIIGEYDKTKSLLTDICIRVAPRNHDLIICLMNVGFRAKNDCVALDCENSSYLLTILLSGTSVIEGGSGSDGSNGKSGSAMKESNRNGTDGKNGLPALNCGRVSFEKVSENASLTLKGGDGGAGGNGGIDRNRSRMWLNYLPDGGNGGDGAAALRCISYSVNGTSIFLEKGSAGEAGLAGSRGDWWCSACYGHNGSVGKQNETVEYK